MVDNKEVKEKNVANDFGTVRNVVMQFLLSPTLQESCSYDIG